MERRKGIETLISILIPLLMLTCAAAKQHIVGGKKYNGWAPNINYTLWAANEHFYVGDWLTFFYQKGYYDVIQVNKADMERCSLDHPIRNDSKGYSYSIQLNQTGDYYFTCSRGQCWNGMKLAIKVEPIPPPTPPPSQPPASATTSIVASWILISAGLILGLFGIY